MKKHHYLRALLGVGDFSSREGCCKLLENILGGVDWSIMKEIELEGVLEAADLSTGQ